MKNKLFISALCCVVFAYSNAQNNVGIGITTPNPKAILELYSTDKGLLIPRLTAAERVAIAPSVTETSLLVFDVDSNLFYYWNGVQWVGFPQSAGGNNISLVFDSTTNTLSITDNGGTLSTVLHFNRIDNDIDSTNELITGVVFNNNGKILTINEGNNTWSTTINVEDNDSDPTNEYNLNFSFNTNTNILSITDAGGTLNVNLSSLNNIYTAGPGISIAGNVITNTGDLSNTNELITGLSFNTATNILTITEGGNTHTANLSSLGNDWKLTGNAGTNPSVNFLGTTDAQDLVFRTSNIERARISASNGFLGIGLTTPDAPLHIFRSGGTVSSPTSKMAQYTNSTQSWELRVGGGNGWLAWVPDVASNKRWQINNENGTTVFNVNVGAPENSFFMTSAGYIEFGLGAGSTRRINLPNSASNDGTGRAFNWETYSDNRIKSNQQPLQYGLKEVLKMQPKSYDHHYSRFTENKEIEIMNQKSSTIGFIAQEMYHIIPEVVSKPEDEKSDLWSMSYEKLVPVLVKAIQQQQEMIEAIKNENASLQTQINEIMQLLQPTHLKAVK